MFVVASGYDIIGDVHGEADKLVGLLAVLGYEDRDGVWRHPDRQAVFVGDLIDRGQCQRRTIDIVRPMVAADIARIVLGNHGFNAIAYATPDPENPGEYLRTRDARHREQHQKFLVEVGEDSTVHREYIEWFKTFPVRLELGGLRVVHACWDEQSFDVLEAGLHDDGSMSSGLIEDASREGTPAYNAVEIVLKGPEIDLGDGRAYKDKDGTSRARARFRWWRNDATTLRAAAEIPSDVPLELPDERIKAPVAPYDSDVPVIFGHYWRSGTPEVISDKVACIDYSAVKGGPLVAYRWDGESDLTSDHLVAYP